MTDRRVFFAVVAFLGATLLLCVTAIAVLAGLDKDAPTILENLGVGSLTGLAGLLAKGPTEGAQEVTVVNHAGEPVPVADAGRADPGVLALAVLFLLVVLLLLGALPTFR